MTLLFTWHFRSQARSSQTNQAEPTQDYEWFEQKFKLVFASWIGLGQQNAPLGSALLGDLVNYLVVPSYSLSLIASGCFHFLKLLVYLKKIILCMFSIYQAFQAIPVINKRQPCWSNSAQNLWTFVNSKKKLSNQLYTVIHVHSICHNFNKLLLRRKFPGRALWSLLELQIRKKIRVWWI